MLFGKPLMKALKHCFSKKSKNYAHLGNGKPSLIKAEERSHLFEDERIKSDSSNIEIKDFSHFRSKGGKQVLKKIK
jgi:hypothetical protein